MSVLTLLWKPILIIILLFGGYEYIVHSAKATQKAVDQKEIASLNQTIGKQQQRLSSDDAAFANIKMKLSNEALQLEQATKSSREADNKALTARKALAKTQKELEARNLAERIDPANAKLQSPECELPDEDY